MSIEELYELVITQLVNDSNFVHRTDDDDENPDDCHEAYAYVTDKMSLDTVGIGSFFQRQLDELDWDDIEAEVCIRRSRSASQEDEIDLDIFPRSIRILINAMQKEPDFKYDRFDDVDLDEYITFHIFHNSKEMTVIAYSTVDQSDCNPGLFCMRGSEAVRKLFTQLDGCYNLLRGAQGGNVDMELEDMLDFFRDKIGGELE